MARDRKGSHDVKALPAELAAAWVVRMHSDQRTAEDEAAFASWLAQDPAHRAAYDDVACTWRDVATFSENTQLRLALAAGDTPRSPGRRRLLAASAGFAAAAAMGFFVYRSGERVIETAVGEQRHAALADGTRVTLDTQSRIRTRFDGAERRIWLDRGQAYFDVAPDKARPFRVFVGREEVRALGTEFQVRRDRDRMRVTLEEGVVAVYRAGEESLLEARRPVQPEVVMRAGDQALVAPERVIQVSAVDIERVSAWRLGKIMLHAEPLSDALAEINRYNVRQIVLEDPSLGAIAVSGVFQTGRPEAFVEALTAGFPIEVMAEDGDTIRLQAVQGR